VSRYLAIDLDPAGLFVVAGTARGGAARVDHALAWTSDTDGGPPPLAADTAKVIGDQLRERLKAGGILPGPAVVAVGRDKVILKEVRYPKVTPAEEPALVRFQALKEITESPDEVVLDYAPVANGAADGEQRALAVVLRKDVFAAIQTACAAAGLKLAGVSPRPFAIAAGLTRAIGAGSAPTPNDPDDAIAVLTLGAGGGEFAVVRHGEVAFTRAVPAPVVASDPMLVAEVKRNLAVYAGQNPGHPVRAVYVAEAGPMGWVARLRAALTVAVHPYDPLDGTAAAVAEHTRGRFAGAAGLLAGRAAGSLPINFAAPRQPKVEADPKRKVLTIAALAFLLLVIIGGGGGWLMLQAADEKVNTLNQKKQTLQKQIGDLEPTRKQLEAVEQWQAREVVWLDELYDMSDRYPTGDLDLTQWAATPIPVDAKTGRQDAQARLVLTVKLPPNKNQDAVAHLITAIEQDSGGRKYYSETTKATQQEVFTITTRVHRRRSDEYTRFEVFSTPSRKLYPATPPPKTETPPSAEEFP
jgi:hypothetical protein